jgi:hypothetical protein
MNKILFRKRIIVAVLLSCLSLIAHAQQPASQIKTLKLDVVDIYNQSVLKASTDRSVKVYTTIPDADSTVQAPTTAWVKKQLYAQGEGLFKRYAIPFGSITGKLTQDSANFSWQNGTLNLGYAGSTSSNSLMLNAGRAEMTGYFNGLKFNVGSGYPAGGVYDISKSYLFQNRGNNYLTIISSSQTVHTSTFYTDLVVNGVVKITGGSPGLSKVLTSDAVGNATWQTPTGGTAGWGLTGNSGIDSATNFLGSINDAPLIFKVNNTRAGLISSANLNTSLGYNSFSSNVSGGLNTAFGSAALRSNTSGNTNTAIGSNCLPLNTTGPENTAVGIGSLYNNISGTGNTALGYQALNVNNTGSYNIGIGHMANVISSALTNATAIGKNALIGVSNAMSLGDSVNCNVGIGTAYPSAKLDVRGTFKLGDGTQGAYKVLTSDASGNASWQAQNKDTSFITAASQSVLQVTTTAGKDSLGFIMQTANKFLASPSGATGNITARAIVAADIPFAGTIDSIRFVNSGVIHSSVAGFSLSGKTAILNQNLVSQAPNTVFAGQNGTAGIPSFRSLVKADISFADTLYVPIMGDFRTALALLGSTIKAEPLSGNASNISALITLLDQTARFTIVYLPKSATITGVKWWQSVSGSYTANNYNGVALYSLSGGNITLIDSTANDGNIWKTAQSFASKPFTQTRSLTAGVYVVASFYCRSAETAAPLIGALAAFGNTGVPAFDLPNSIKIQTTQAAQLTPPLSRAYSTLSVSSNNQYLSLY